MANSVNTNEFPPEQYPYRIRNWSKFQHYKKRNPPWIKLHISMLSSEDWVVLDDASKLLAVVCMMIASKHEGHIPASASMAYFKRVAYLEKLPNLKPLIECGFLEKTLADAPLYEQATARPETETETETEHKEEREVASLPLPMNGTPEKEKTKQGHRLPEDWMPNAKGQAFAVAQFGDDGARDEYEDFRDYWLAKPGKDGRKLDWDRTWMKWCRNSRRGGNAPNGSMRNKTEKEKYGELLQSLGSGEIRSDITGVISKLYPD